MQVMVTEVEFHLRGVLIHAFPRLYVWTGKWANLIDCMDSFRPTCTVIPVRWQMPNVFKLNTDGSCLGNPGPGAGGGVLRDAYGRLVFGFYGYFGNASSLQAEARALLLGLKLCARNGLKEVEVECDSKVLVQMLNGSVASSWMIMTIMKKISRYRLSVVTFGHCYPEVNTVADSLAALGQQLRCFQLYTSMVSLPKQVRALIDMDSKQVSNLQVRRRW